MWLGYSLLVKYFTIWSYSSSIAAQNPGSVHPDWVQSHLWGSPNDTVVKGPPGPTEREYSHAPTLELNRAACMHSCMLHKTILLSPSTLLSGLDHLYNGFEVSFDL